MSVIRNMSRNLRPSSWWNASVYGGLWRSQSWNIILVPELGETQTRIGTNFIV